MRNKLLIVAALGALALGARAEGGDDVLVFRHTDGTTQWINAANLQITIAEGTLAADNGSQSLSVAMGEL